MTMQQHIDAACRAQALRNEQIIRLLLERWVSELQPSVAYQDGQIIGLTLADAPIGSQPFVLRV